MKQFKISDDEIKEMYLSGKSMREIAAIAQDTKGLMSLRKRLHQMGVQTNMPMKRYAHRFGKRIFPLDEELFDNIDSADKAYWLGFLFADGYNQENRHEISLTLQCSDENHLIKFQRFLKTTRPVSHHTRNEHEYVRLEINSKNISRALAKHGCVKAKAHICKYPNIQQEFNRDFIRGYFDGDGCFSHTDNNRAWQLNFTGNKEMISAIQTIIENELHCSHLKLHTRKDKSSVTLHFSGKNICGRVLGYMYDGANTYLDRKYDKYCKLYLGGVTRNNNKPRELMETPTSTTGDNHEPSLGFKEGATTIPKGSTPKRVEVRGSEKSDDDIV